MYNEDTMFDPMDEETSSLFNEDHFFDAQRDLEAPERRTVAAKEKERKQLNEDMERFLQSGGRIQSVAIHVMADPPKKPTIHYGAQPI